MLQIENANKYLLGMHTQCTRK